MGRAEAGDEAAGLTIDAEKTGAMAIGAPLPADLPPGPVRWGMLALDGPTFRVDGEALAAFVETTRLRVYGHEALLDRVVAWRDQLRYLWTWLAPTADLGPDHLDAVDAAVRRLSHGMAAMLRQEVERRFLGGSGASLPDAWLHWPITAGGVGLPYPAADLVPLRLAARDRERVGMPAPVAHPDDDPAWGRWFRAQLVAAEAVSPSETPTMEPLVARFLERGARMGQEGRTLSPYWRWVLHTLGPDVLEAYGTFDFVSTDLVPVQLIRATSDGLAGHDAYRRRGNAGSKEGRRNGPTGCGDCHQNYGMMATLSEEPAWPPLPASGRGMG